MPHNFPTELIIDGAVRKALEMAVERAGGQRAFSAEIGVSTSMPGKWLGNASRVIKSISWDTWEQVYPKILEWLPPDPRYLPMSKRTGLVLPAVAASRTCHLYGLAQCAASGAQLGAVRTLSVPRWQGVPGEYQ